MIFLQFVFQLNSFEADGIKDIGSDEAKIRLDWSFLKIRKNTYISWNNVAY